MNLIREDYSPEQIVGLAKLKDKECVSIERIYHIYGKIRSKEECYIECSDAEKENKVYITVQIGSQLWMSRNLDVVRFRNGDLIQEAKSSEQWKIAGENSQPAWCHYSNETINGEKYGKLYNWFAVNDTQEVWHHSGIIYPILMTWYC